MDGARVELRVELGAEPASRGTKRKVVEQVSNHHSDTLSQPAVVVRCYTFQLEEILPEMIALMKCM